MYSPEAIYLGQNGFHFAEVTEPDDLIDEESLAELSEETFSEEDDIDVEALLEGEASEEDFPDDEETLAESDLSFLVDNSSLTQLTNEINSDVGRMNESEASDYMEDRMAEFWPALAAALPTIIDLAPKAIDAVGSLFKKDPPKPSQPATPTPPAPVANVPGTPVATPKAPSTPAPAVPPIATAPAPVATPKAPSTPAPTAPPIATAPAPVADGNSAAVLKVLIELIQSPKFLEMLAGMMAGNSPTVTTNSGQEINGSNVLGVVSSLAGALAGTAAKESTESVFPEYAISAEGTFVIDPHNSLQEGQLILNMIH